MLEKEVNRWLNPTRFDYCFWILTLLRKQLEVIAKENLSSSCDHVLVDYGCGTMPYRQLFESYTSKYYGADIKGNPVAEVEIQSNGSLNISDDFATVVLSTQVLEHVTCPKSYLAECYRILKPGGRLVLSTHGYWVYHPCPTDFWRWTGQGLQKIIQEAGFEIERFEGLMGMPATSLQLFQDSICPHLPRVIRIPLRLIIQQLISLIDYFEPADSKQKDACVFITVACKPIQRISC